MSSRALHDPAAENDPVGGEHGDDAEYPQREVVGFKRPGRVLVGQLGRRAAPPRLQGRAAGQSLPAVAVQRARARIGVAFAVVGDAQVPHLGVQKTVARVAVDEQARPDARPRGQIGEARRPLPGAPALLADGRGGDVEVEDDGHAEALAQDTRHRGVAPAGFRGVHHVTPGRGVGVDVDGPERPDAHRPWGRMGGEERGDAFERLGRLGGPEGLPGFDRPGTLSERAHAPGASRLDSAIQP